MHIILCTGCSAADPFDDFDIRIGVMLDEPPPVQKALRGNTVRTLYGLKLIEARKMPFRSAAVITQNNAGCRPVSAGLDEFGIHIMNYPIVIAAFGSAGPAIRLFPYDRA